MMTDTREAVADEVLLHVADTLFVRHSTGSIVAALAEFFRFHFKLEASGFMALGTGGDAILDVSAADLSPETVAMWRDRMERAVAAYVHPDGGGTPPAKAFALPLLHEGELQGVLCFSEPMTLPAETLAKMASWMYRLRKLKAMAALDPLTGLHNRHHIEELSAGVLNLCRHNRQPVSLAMLDLDHFKTINDVCGHHRGDQILAAFSERLLHTTRGSDLAFRLGGDEFMIIMPDTRLAEAVKAARRIRAAAEEIEVCSDQPGIPCRVSVGLVEGSGFNKWQELHAQADAALYVAKRSGRNTIAAVQPGTDQVELVEAAGASPA